MQCLPTHATRSAILGRLEWLGWLGRQSAVLSHRDAGSAGARLNGCTHRRTVVGRNSHRINAANRRRAMRALREYAACPRIIAESILCQYHRVASLCHLRQRRNKTGLSVRWCAGQARPSWGLQEWRPGAAPEGTAGAGPGARLCHSGARQGLALWRLRRLRQSRMPPSPSRAFGAGGIWSARPAIPRPGDC